MTGETGWTDPRAVALAHLAAYRDLPDKAAKHTWSLARALARSLRSAPPQFVLQVARELFAADERKGHAWMLLNLHKGAFALLDEAEVEAFGQGIEGWGAVDGYARLVSGPAWLRGQIPDATIHCWARSGDRWWRRAALVSTVALNVRSHGGYGDVPRTLEVCRMLLDDHDDMVVKAMSWALRELVVHDPDAVWAFLRKHDETLAARVKREVRNKLTTGRKN
jgi:3-methyladenine DNA glycosylase AlkD